MATLVRR